MTEKTVAFIVARLTSSRMPGKHFRHIGSDFMIKWIVDQLKQCTEIDEIVIATVNEPESSALAAFAGNEGIKCYLYDGNVEHVTSRLCEAAECYCADICVLISGDCPLVYAPAIDDLVKKFKAEPDANILQIKGGGDGLYVALHGVMVDRLSAWQLAEELSVLPELKEHQFPVISLYPEKFNKLSCSLPDELYAPEYHLSIDTWSDLRFFNAIYAGLEKQEETFNLPNALQFLKENPELKNINAHVHQRTLKEVVHSVMVVLDIRGGDHHERLQESISFGLQVVERLSWPVSFLINTMDAMDELTEKGFTVYCHPFSGKSLPIGKDMFIWNDMDNFDIAVLNLSDCSLIELCRESIPADIPVLLFDTVQDDKKVTCGEDGLLLVQELVAQKACISDVL